MAWRYDVLELSTAVKPWLLCHLLARGGATITYLDPDIRVFGPWLRSTARARARPGADAPRHDADPGRWRAPSQIDIMIAGVYNLGYLPSAGGRDPSAARLVDRAPAPRLSRGPGLWLLRRSALVRSRARVCVRLRVVRDPEYNVAYWNSA